MLRRSSTDLDCCIEWASNNGMLFNVAKSVFIQFGSYPTRPTQFRLEMADQVISDSVLVKESGILILNNLKWGPHFAKKKIENATLFSLPIAGLFHLHCQNSES